MVHHVSLNMEVFFHVFDVNIIDDHYMTYMTLLVKN